MSSSESETEALEQSSKKRKPVREIAREAQEEHKLMCTKAMNTLDRVNNLLGKVDDQIEKSKEKAD